MAMRNFWLTADIDGRTTPLAGGPVRKDGGFALTVRMRDNGASVVACRIDGYVAQTGELVVTAEDEATGTRFTRRTQR